MTTRTVHLSLPLNRPATGAPLITGTATVGQELAVDVTGIEDEDGLHDIEYTYQWVRVDADGTSNEADITDATADTYTLTDDDLGKKVKIEVSFSDDFGSDEQRTSAPTDTVTAVAMTTPGVTVSTTALTVTEEDTTGDSYTVVLDSQPTANVTVTVAGHAGTDVTPSPTSLTFTTTTWGTAQTVTVTAGDDADTANDAVTLTHSAASTDTGYEGISIDGVAVTVNDNDTAPATGAPTVNDVAVTSTPASGTTYYLAGEVIEFTVTFSAPVTVTATPKFAFRLGAATRQAAYASGSDSAALVFARTVQAGEVDRNGISWNAIALALDGGTITRMGATTAARLTHAEQAPLEGHRVDAAPPMQVSASVQGLSLVLVYDEPLDPASMPATGAYTVTATVGATTTNLEVSEVSIYGIWVTLALDAAPAAGATVTLAYAPPASNPVQDEAGNDAPAFSGQKVNGAAGNTAATGAPTITGTAEVGQTLTAVTTGIMDADGLTSPTYTYQWIRVDGTEADIAGENSSTYTLVDADLGKTLKVRVSFDDDLGHTETLTSEAYPTSGAVTAADPAVCAVPSLSGRTVIWTGAMTVAADPIFPGVFGFESELFGSLDDQTFTVGANDYTTGLVSLMGNVLTFATTNSALTAGEQAVLRLHVCAADLDFSAATGPTGDHGYLFATTGLSWSSGDTLTLRLSLPAVPPPPPPPPGPRQTVPGAPTNLMAEATDAAVTLTWDAPEDDGGSAVTDYEYRINGRGGWVSIDSTLTTYTVTGLVNGTTYVFQVRAVNAAGRSLPSNRAEATPRATAALDFAHFANGASWQSGLVFVNGASHPIRPAVYFYDKEGNPIDPESVVDLTGDLEVQEDGALSVQRAMAPLGELTISTHGQGELVTGSVTVSAKGPIGGVLRYARPDIGVAGVGVGQPVRDALFPARRQAGGISTAAALHNLGEEAMTVNCRLMSGGIVLEEVEIFLGANGQEARYIEELFTGADTSDFVGSVRCMAPGLFTGVAVEIDAENRILTTLPVVPVARAGGGGQETVLNFAHSANGNGTTSDLVFVNVSTRPSGPGLSPYHAVILPSRPALYFYDQEGNLIDPESVVDLMGDLVVTEDGALSIQTEMEPLGELTISTHGRGELVSGSVKVVSEGPIGGVLRYALPGIGVTGVGASQSVRDALFPVRQEGGLDTAAAIRNLSESELVVTCRLMKEGAVLEETEIPLAANGQESQYIEEMFTFTGADVSNFVGSVRCTVPAEGEGMFTGVAVEIDVGNRILTTLPVVPVTERMSQE